MGQVKKLLYDDTVKPEGKGKSPYPIEEECRFCGNISRTYRRKFPKGGLKSLVSLYRKPNDYHHVKRLYGYDGGGDFAKLRWWGLIEQKPKLDDSRDTKTTGMWRITPTGVAFVNGKYCVYEYVIVENNHVRGFGGDELTIDEACDRGNFSYSELMGYKNAKSR